MTSRYSFVDYDREWPSQFEREATIVRSLLGDIVVAVHHIGSTSVPGLAAKPIIDLLPLVDDITHVDTATPTLEANGYRPWGEYGLPGRRFFTRDDAAGWRTHNVHIYAATDPEAERHLAFPAYLRTHADAAAEYARIKRRAYALHPADIGAYNDAKNDWIAEHQERALHWWQQQTG